MSEAALSHSTARLAGALYLGTIVFGLFAEVGARGSLIVGSDAGATARAILADEPLFRAGLVSDLAMLACYVGVTTLFLGMFRPVHAGVSRMAAAFSLTGIAVLAADTLSLLVPLRLLTASPYLAVLQAQQREATALLALKVHGDGYDVSLVFFGVYLPDAGMADLAQRLRSQGHRCADGAGGSLLHRQQHRRSGSAELCPGAVASLMDPTLIGEGALALWLLVFGTRKVGVATRTIEATSARTIA